MKENNNEQFSKNITIEIKTGEVLTVEFFGKEILQKDKFQDLVRAYATSYWAGSWKELLKRKGEAVQYGTFNSDGEIYRETKQILAFNNINQNNPDWPYILWSMAGMGMLYDLDGQELEPFWTSESAGRELSEFVLPVNEGGYGGEIAIVYGENGECAGFAAYATGPAEIADRRFPYENLVLPDGEIVEAKLSEVLRIIYGDRNYGIFLDFAVGEKYRNKGIASKLFDLRVNRLGNAGAEVLIGRTIKTSPAQYFGNYLKRGMSIIAYDSQNSDKALFAVETKEIINR